MKRVLLFLCVFTLAGCTNYNPDNDSFAGQNDQCVEVTVDNRNYETIDVWLGVGKRIRLGTIPGFTERVYSVCRWRRVRALFTVHAVGGRFDFRKNATHSHLHPSNPLTLIINPSPRGTGFVIGHN